LSDGVAARDLVRALEELAAVEAEAFRDAEQAKDRAERLRRSWDSIESRADASSVLRDMMQENPFEPIRRARRRMTALLDAFHALMRLHSEIPTRPPADKIFRLLREFLMLDYDEALNIQPSALPQTDLAPEAKLSWLRDDEFVFEFLEEAKQVSERQARLLEQALDAARKLLGNAPE
jgi:hypothetical protein